VSDCEHDDFAARVEVHRLADDHGRIRNFVAEITVRCARCDEPFHFVGPDAGFSFVRPTVSVGATTLHAPICSGEAPIPDRIRFEMPPKEST